jgi:hypothetical protein
MRADQFGMPVALSVPVIIDEQTIAVFIPNDDSQVSTLIKFLSENINPGFNKEALAKRLFTFIKPILTQSRTMGLDNFDLKKTNIQTVKDGENVKAIEIGFFENHLGTKKMQQIRGKTILFTDNKPTGIKKN